MLSFEHPVTFQELDLVSHQARVFGGPGFLPESIADGLVELAGTLATRKQAWQFPYPLPDDTELPSAIARAVEWADGFGVPSNTAILKRYTLADPYVSEAHELHEDPDEYNQHRIALLTASGWADLRVKERDGRVITLPGGERTAIFAAPGVVHAVTPPLNPTGIRDFLFLGYDHTLEPSAVDTTRDILPSLGFMSGVLSRMFTEK